MPLNAANGSYSPSFYSIHIETIENIEQCIESNEQTFVHEYIHFLQDISLPYSIRNTLVTNRNFLYIHQNVHEKGYIERPFNDYDDDMLATHKQFSYTWGCDEFIPEKFKIVSIENDFYVMDNIDNQSRVFRYMLTLENGLKYHIGARDFLEYIAHKIESKHWQTNHFPYPYMTVDFLFEYMGYGNIHDIIKVCFIEFSLQNDNPVHYLLEVIKFFKQQKISILSIDYNELKQLLLSIQWKSQGNFTETSQTKTSRRLNQLLESGIKKHNTSSLSDVLQWFDEIINFSNTELANRFIFSELLSMNEDEFLKKINYYVSKIGIPLVFNDNSECISLLPEKYDQNQFLNIHISLLFIRYISQNESNQCPLKSYCAKNINPNENIISPSCDSDPIQKLTEGVQCPLTRFMKLYSFDSIEWR